MKAKFKRWTAKEERQLKQLVSERMPAVEIARIMSRTERAIVSKMTRMNAKSDSLRGSYSKVLEGKSNGGVITIRVPQSIHERFLKICHGKRKSMNQHLVDMMFNVVNST